MDWLWVPQVAAALLFLGSAYAHGVAWERSRERMVWLVAIGRNAALVVALLDVLGAIGLILPMATGTLVWLTPVAALCLVLLMVLAIVFHVARREWPNIVLNTVFGILAAIVAYGRWALLGG